MNIKNQLDKILNKGQRTDRSLSFIWGNIILNHRIQYYKMYIMLALSREYKVCSFIDFYNDRDSDVKHLVLRHDVDQHNPIATRKLFEAELDCGVKSTYYFRKSTVDRQLIIDMINAGFEVGFHYETIADYAKEHNCESIDQINMKEVSERLKSDITDFNLSLKYTIRSCASHGDAMNRKLKCSNNILFENTDPRYFGVEIEAYNRDLYESYIDSHIMDGPIMYNYGFSYKLNPIDEILAERRNIVFLAHPNHWYLTLKDRLVCMLQLLLKKAVFDTNREFKRI